MLTHDDIWRGIDRLAAQCETSPSGLARRAGLDPTTFNPSKRVSADGGKPRWPSTESIAKALAAARISFDDFAALISGKSGRTALPVRDLADGDGQSAFDACGLPAGDGWRRIAFPDTALTNAYALRVRGDSMAPVYRAGDRLVVSPDERPRPGDRVVVKMRDGEIGGWELGESSVQDVALKPLAPGQPEQVRALTDIVWMARIVWVSQ